MQLATVLLRFGRPRGCSGAISFLRERIIGRGQLIVLFAVFFASQFLALRARALSQESSEQPSAPAGDFDAEQRDLERQKAEIDKKLADLAARRRGQKATTQKAVTGAKAEPSAAPGRNEPGTTATPAAPPVEAPAEAVPAKTDVEKFSVHGQATVVTQKHDVFHAPYSGQNSLPKHEGEKTSVTATLFFGLRTPWDGGAIYFDPEGAGGQGLGGVTGIAGFPNGEIPRVSTPEFRPYVARLYYQQIFDLGGEKKHVDSDQNQLAGFLPERRITVTAGKFSVVDFFDGNAYSHDPRTQFLNWSLMDQGAWDYPADTRGYTEGVVVEYNEPAWAIRYAGVAVPTTANGATLDDRIPRRMAHALEFEDRYTLGTHPGTVRVLGYLNAAHMGSYREALFESRGMTPDITRTRADRIKYGFSLNLEQEITPDFGVFSRLGWNDGHTETWAFTEIDRSASLGFSLKGTRWQRPDDVVGIGGVLNGISKEHREYLAAGGLGFIIGDGRLPHYGLEKIVEGYYMLKVTEHVFVTGDLQLVVNPAYNRDRGPVFIGGVRVHAAF